MCFTNIYFLRFLIVLNDNFYLLRYAVRKKKLYFENVNVWIFTVALTVSEISIYKL